MIQFPAHRNTTVIACVLMAILAGFSSGLVRATFQEAMPDGLSVDRNTIDAGDLFLGQTAKYEFALTNSGQLPAKIRLYSTCGCTVVRFDESIAAGESGKIEVDLLTNGLPMGPVTKSVFVYANDRKKHAIQLSLKANIVSVLQRVDQDRSPIVLNWETATVREVRIRALGAEPVEFTGASCSVGYATATVRQLAPEGAGNLYKLTVTIDPSAPGGQAPLTVLVATTSPSERMAIVNFSLEKGIIAKPGALVLKTNPDTSQPAEPAVLTLSRSDGLFQIKKIESADFDLESKIETIREGQEYRISIICRSQESPGERATMGLVKIQTDDPFQPVIEVRAINLILPGKSGE